MNVFGLGFVRIQVRRLYPACAAVVFLAGASAVAAESEWRSALLTEPGVQGTCSGGGDHAISPPAAGSPALAKPSSGPAAGEAILLDPMVVNGRRHPRDMAELDRRLASPPTESGLQRFSDHTVTPLLVNRFTILRLGKVRVVVLRLGTRATVSVLW